jgi:Mg-chelatase subunit ChlI
VYCRNYINDSLRTDVFLRFPPETIACACIDLAARNLQIPLPRNPPWYLTFGAQTEEIRYIMIAILRLYQHRPKPLEELEKFVNTLREKREGERRKLRIELGNDSPAPQQMVPISNPSTVAASSTPTIVQSELLTSVITTTTTTTEETNNAPTILNGKSTITKKQDRESSHESPTAITHQHHHHRNKQSSTRSRSSSRSPSRSPARHSQKKKKTSHRSRSRSRSSSRKRHRHQKDKRHHSSHTSNNHRRKDKKHRSRSTSREDNHYSSNHKHSGSSKDANNNLHQRSSKQINGVSSSSHKKINLK